MSTALMSIGIVLMFIGAPQFMASASSVGAPVLASVSAFGSPILLTQTTTDQGLSNLGTMFSQILSWLGEIMTDVIFAHPVLFVGLAIFVVGAIIALIYRMIRGG